MHLPLKSFFSVPELMSIKFSFSTSSLLTTLTNVPPTKAVIIAANGRIMAKGIPINEAVAKMESIPV